MLFRVGIQWLGFFPVGSFFPAQSYNQQKETGFLFRGHHWEICKICCRTMIWSITSCSSVRVLNPLETLVPPESRHPDRMVASAMIFVHSDSGLSVCSQLENWIVVAVVETLSCRHATRDADGGARPPWSPPQYCSRWIKGGSARTCQRTVWYRGNRAGENAEQRLQLKLSKCPVWVWFLWTAWCTVAHLKAM